MKAPTKEQIKIIVDDASNRFWAEIAARFPECESGDFPPDATNQWDIACEKAVETWLRYNHPLLNLPCNVEFPEYFDVPEAITDLAITKKIKDCSWVNDMTPSFSSLDDERILWVHPSDPEKRELKEFNRFMVQRTPGGQMPDIPIVIYDGDDEAAAIKALLEP
jgi:hypothetical protein